MVCCNNRFCRKFNCYSSWFIEFNLATVAALGTGFFYGIYLVITRKLHTSDSPLLTLLLTGVVGGMLSLHS